MMIPLSLAIDELPESEENGDTETVNNEESDEPDKFDESEALEDPEELDEEKDKEKDPEEPPKDYNEMLKTLDYQTEIIEQQTFILSFLICVQVGTIIGLGFLVLWRPTND